MEVLIYNAHGVEVESREEPDDFTVGTVADFLGMLGYVDEETFEIDPFESDNYGGYESAKIGLSSKKIDRMYYLDFQGRVPGNNPENWVLEYI